MGAVTLATRHRKHGFGASGDDQRRDNAARTHEYELGHTDWELERLRRQAELVDPFTRQFYATLESRKA